jgi:hypothetical protein
LSPEKYIFGNIQVRTKAELLVNCRNSGQACLEWIAEMNMFIVQIDFAPVGLVDAGDHLDQRGFSRAVLS